MKPAIIFSMTMMSITMMFIASSVSAQDLFPLKRKPYLLTVAVDKKTTYEENLPEANYVLPDQTVQLYPGETVFIEIEQENGVVKNVRAVAENKFPEKTLIISFTQISKKKVHEGMMLKIQNPFKYKLKYDAKTYLLNYKNWVNARVLPIQPALSAYETWAEVITSVAVGNLSFEL
ncbi:hypothetical protein [Flavitalea sp.]|nr:hypothetical protein [Flavitalea sp.]